MDKYLEMALANIETVKAKVAAVSLELSEAYELARSICPHLSIEEYHYKWIDSPPFRKCLTCGLREDGWTWRKLDDRGHMIGFPVPKDRVVKRVDK